VNTVTKDKKKKREAEKGGASSMSSMPAKNQSRSIAYNPKFKHLAVADNKGTLSIRQIDWADVDAGK
jgi:hypothetical protein